jgi:hypothetical protein
MKLFRRFALAAALACTTFLAALPAQATSLTDYLEGALLGHLFRATAFTAPASLYIRLNTSSCGDAASGTEVSGGAYARVAVTSGAGAWAAPTGGNGTTSNLAVIAFPTPTVSWGTVTSFEVMDAASAGNSLICQTLTQSKTINIGDTVSFPIGTLTVQIDN